MLDKRLKQCAEQILGWGTVCDVGTDHGLLAVELIKTGKCKKVIASDINHGPLEAARKNVEASGLSEQIELVMSDGLQKINPEQISDIVIAGMGGETIVKILEECPFDLFTINLVLQPMTKQEVVREWLIEHDFSVYEKGVEDNGRLYSVMSADQYPSDKMLTEFQALRGFFDDNDTVGAELRRRSSVKMREIGETLREAGKMTEAVHMEALSRKMVEGSQFSQINDVYSYLNERFPFSLQEKWDNSGMLVESEKKVCQTILLTLDITNEAVEEARRKGAELIISHHPVIFERLSFISANSPVYRLAANGICAVCLHTNLDIADGGTNTVMLKRMNEKLHFSGDIQPLEDSGLGCIASLAEPMEKAEFAAVLKEVFGCQYVKMNKTRTNYISKIAMCSGSGGSLFRTAFEKGCDVLITGDVKHDIWIDAGNLGFTIMNCGHFHTENIVLWELRRVLEERFPLLDIEIAETSVDPCLYV
ncbi:MAG: Nif3-like dinuclear metal center hexameric protein [Alistipes sp.]|nr:Nif3-like dinuclear metal center hexameric protein [Alistipes sp.]